MKYKCPFCDAELSKDEMRFHVGIPLCMEIRIQTSPSEEMPHVMKELRTPVSPLYLEYFGEENMKHLLSLQFQRMGYGYPNDGPIPLESYRKGEKPLACSVCERVTTIHKILEILPEKRNYKLCEGHQQELAFAWASDTLTKYKHPM